MLIIQPARSVYGAALFVQHIPFFTSKPDDKMRAEHPDVFMHTGNQPIAGSVGHLPALNRTGAFDFEITYRFGLPDVRIFRRDEPAAIKGH